MSAEIKLLKLQLAQAKAAANKKTKPKKKTKKKTSKKKSGFTGLDFIALVMLAAGLYWGSGILKLHANDETPVVDHYAQKYLSDEDSELLDEMDEYLKYLKSEYSSYPNQENIIVCWNSDQQRLVPTYMGCD